MSLMGKIALITGITGQDGYYLSALLLGKGYELHGLVQPLVYDDTHTLAPFLDQITLHRCDLCDGGAITRILNEIKPDEIYNLGAQSHVGMSFDVPEYTTNVNALGTLRLLESLRALKLENTTRFYQASTSEIFGDTPPPQTEHSLFNPRSPYASAKLYAYHLVKNYREAYGFHASNGILFNHESPKRGYDFVTRKVTRAVASIGVGQKECVDLGNLNAIRDWGHAADYVEGMWLMLQQEQADDYILATGEGRSVRELCDVAFSCIGVSLTWIGEGEEEKGIDRLSKQVRVRVDQKLFRPLDVENLRGDPTKAQEKLGWRRKTSFKETITEMVKADQSCLIYDIKRFG